MSWKIRTKQRLSFFNFLKKIKSTSEKDLEELETPTGISPDWYLATKRTKMAAIAIVKYGLPE